MSNVCTKQQLSMCSVIDNTPFLYNPREQKQPLAFQNPGECPYKSLVALALSHALGKFHQVMIRRVKQHYSAILIFSFDFMLDYKQYLKSKKNMHYNPFTANLLDVATLPTLHSNYLSTLTFVYPTQNLSSLIDFHYNYNHSFQHIPLLYHPLALPQTETTFQNVIDPITFKNKIKKPRNRDQKKELQSAKKNSESNLVNQLYSYFSNYQKSEKLVQRAILGLKKSNFEIQKIKTVFYNTVRLINFKRGRKYVNKESILAYYSSDICSSNLQGIAQQLKNLNVLSIQEFCYLFRVCTSHFFREISLNAVLTSKRISSVARNEHLKRRRKVVLALRGLDLN